MPVSRYHRQQLLPEIGHEGQARIARAAAAVVGVGALGCVIADLLCRAGMGHLILIDRDIVEPTNLQRQTLFTEADAKAAQPKAIAARARLAQVNSTIDLTAHAADLTAENIEDILEPATIILDATDNFETRYLLNDYAVDAEVPLVLGGAVATRGTVLPILPGIGPCLRCLHASLPEQSETCDTAGILAPITNIIAARQAALALRILAKGPADVPIAIESYDAWTGHSRSIHLAAARDPNCPCCGSAGRREFLEGQGLGRTVRLCGRNAVQVSPATSTRIDTAAIAQRLAAAGSLTSHAGILRATIPAEHSDHAYEITLFPDGRAIVKGTEEPARARAIYTRYVGG